MKKIVAISILTSFGFFIVACGGGSSDTSTTSTSASAVKTDATPAAGGIEKYDPKRGEGKFKDVVLSDKLDAGMADAGSKTFDVKCSACHKLSDEKLVGPGWKGVTTRHSAPWIMNFITNTDEMINKDPAAQAQLEICLVRMPNQNLTDADARALLEFMRKTDGVK